MRTTFACLIIAGAISGCQGGAGSQQPEADSTKIDTAAIAPVDMNNKLTDTEKNEGWQLLFDGRTLAGWRGVGYDTVPTAHWVIADGAIKKVASGNVPRVADGRPLAGGDLMTVDSFADFELSFEWRVTPGANSGVKDKMSEAMSIAQGGAGTQGGPRHSALGFDYQVLVDDRHEDGKLASHRSGALEELVAA